MRHPHAPRSRADCPATPAGPGPGRGAIRGTLAWPRIRYSRKNPGKSVTIPGSSAGTHAAGGTGQAVAARAADGAGGARPDGRDPGRAAFTGGLEQVPAGGLRPARGMDGGRLRCPARFPRRAPRAGPGRPESGGRLTALFCVLLCGCRRVGKWPAVLGSGTRRWGQQAAQVRGDGVDGGSSRFR